MKFPFVLILLAACVAGDATDSETEAIGGNTTCPDWMCGTNSPVIDGLDFHELNLDGLPEARGYTLGVMAQGGSTYRVNVSSGRIIGTKLGGLPGDPEVLAGAALINAQIAITNSNLPKTYVLRLTAVDQTQYWAHHTDGTRPWFETYVIDWNITQNNVPVGHWQNVCPHPVENRELDGTQFMDRYHALVFEGERISSAYKTIAPVLDPRWFNIGCAGGTLAKLQLDGHTQVAQNAGYTTTIAERQTMLKMLSGDYCGVGRPFTVAGMPLEYHDDHGTLSIGRPSTVEAAWGPNGAVCLNTPRVVANPTALSLTVFPMTASAFETAIANTCGPTHVLAPCPVRSAQVYHLVSENPINP
jgi:ADYC domain